VRGKWKVKVEDESRELGAGQRRTEQPARRERPLIAFFDYPIVFDDFYPEYGVDQRTFATRWAATGNHAFLTLLQREAGDVIWYVFALTPELDEARHELVGCRVKFFPCSRLHRWLWNIYYLHPASWRWRHWRHGYPIFALLGSYLSQLSLPFLRALWRDRPDFIFMQDYATGRFDVMLLLARLLGIPLIAYHSGSRPEGYVGGFVRRWTLRRADRLLVSSEDEREMLIRRYRVPPDRIAIVLTPIDTAIYRPLDRAAACANAGLDPTRRHVLFVGRLDPVKCVDAIIRSFAALAPRHPDANLIIAGTGPQEQWLQDIAREQAPGRVRFLGWVAEPEKKARLYNAAECLVLASEREGFPTVVGEALACGTPVLATRVGGVPELVIDGETGWLVPPGDEQALKDRLAFVLAHRERVASMRASARAIAEKRVAPSVIAEQLKRCFSQPNAPKSKRHD
jgi:glycosyltransferase involved in cell wall biosynthesis